MSVCILDYLSFALCIFFFICQPFDLISSLLPECLVNLFASSQFHANLHFLLLLWAKLCAQDASSSAAMIHTVKFISCPILCLSIAMNLGTVPAVGAIVYADMIDKYVCNLWICVTDSLLNGWKAFVKITLWNCPCWESAEVCWLIPLQL